MKFALHIQKNRIGSLKNLEREQNRDNKNNRNEQIDPTRSHLNYELVPQSRDLYEKTTAIVEKAKATGSRVQVNSIVDVSSIVTVSCEHAQKMGEREVERYFKTVVEYYITEFGEENVTSAIVHMDETSPHMHVHFTPINLENGKLQARQVMTRGRVIKLQNEIPKYLQAHGFDVERGSDGRAKDYVATIPELKEKSKKELRAIKQEIHALEPSLEIMKKTYQKAKEGAETRSKELKHLSETLKKEQQALEQAKQQRLQLENDLNLLFQQKMALEEGNEELKKESASLSDKNAYISAESILAMEISKKTKKATEGALNERDGYVNEISELKQTKKDLEMELETKFKKSIANQSILLRYPNTAKTEKNLMGKSTGKVVMEENDYQEFKEMISKAQIYIKNRDSEKGRDKEYVAILKTKRNELNRELNKLKSNFESLKKDWGNTQEMLGVYIRENETLKKEIKELSPQPKIRVRDQGYDFEL